MVSPKSSLSSTDRPTLGMWDAISIIVGIIIGSTIFEMAPLIFALSNNSGLSLSAWLLGGLLSIAGAMCYAELASAYPSAGGDYTFLSRAYGRFVGFFFAWAELAVIRTGGSIGVITYVFASYADRLIGFRAMLPATLAPYSLAILAVAAVLVLAAINALGVSPGKWMQNILTFVKVIGLGGIIATGIWVIYRPDPPAINWTQLTDNQWPSLHAVALVMVFVFYAYGGWNEAAYVAAEVRDPRRTTALALIVGVGLVTVIYLAVNLGYLLALGYDGAKSSQAIAADVFAKPFGETGAKVMSLLVMISALGAMNGLLFTGMRLYGTFGSDFSLFAALRPRSEGSPAIGALVAQVVFTLALIAVVELGPIWKPWLAQQMAPAPAEAVDTPPQAPNGPEAQDKDNQDQKAQPQESKSFQQLVICTAPVFWLFFLLSGLSLFILRGDDPDTDRPFRVPLYPLTPLAFCASSAFMLYMSTAYALSQQPAEALLVGVLLAAGLPLYVVSALLGRGRSAGGTTLLTREIHP